MPDYRWGLAAFVLILVLALVGILRRNRRGTK
jgi:uncharacterized membrane protein